MNNKSSGEQTVSFRRILLPLDGSSLGEAALPYVEELASVTGAEVVLFHVVNPRPELGLVDGYSPELGQMAEAQVSQALEAAREYLGRIRDRLADRGITARCEVEIGSPADRVVAYASEANVDLVAMSTHGRSGIGRWLLGSVADEVLHAANRPVMLVRGTGAEKEKD